MRSLVDGLWSLSKSHTSTPGEIHRSRKNQQINAPESPESAFHQGLCDASPPSVTLIPPRKFNGNAGKPGTGS